MRTGSEGGGESWGQKEGSEGGGHGLWEEEQWEEGLLEEPAGTQGRGEKGGLE